MNSKKSKKTKDEEHREVDLKDASAPVTSIFPEKVTDTSELGKIQADLAELLLSNEKANQTLEKLDSRVSDSSSDMNDAIEEVKARVAHLEGAVAAMKFGHSEEKHSDPPMNETQIRALVVQTARSMITQSSR